MERTIMKAIISIGMIVLWFMPIRADLSTNQVLITNNLILCLVILVATKKD